MAVVVAVDLSVASACAAAEAGRLAVRLGEQLTVLHVTWPPPAGPAEATTGLSALARVQRQASTAVIEQLRRRLHAEGVNVSTRVVFGNPKDKVVEYVTNHPTSILVLGPSRPVTGAKRLLTGGLSEGIITRAPCPVLVMPHGSAPSAPPVSGREGMLVH